MLRACRALDFDRLIYNSTLYRSEQAGLKRRSRQQCPLRPFLRQHIALTRGICRKHKEHCAFIGILLSNTATRRWSLCIFQDDQFGSRGEFVSCESLS